MRELNFSGESVTEAFEEIHESFEGGVEREIEGNTTEFLNGMLRVEASRKLGADLHERTLRRLHYCAGYRPRDADNAEGDIRAECPEGAIDSFAVLVVRSVPAALEAGG
jgi:hypothetical protein